MCLIKQYHEANYIEVGLLCYHGIVLFAYLDLTRIINNYGLSLQLDTAKI